jgi:hypothetical protein
VLLEVRLDSDSAAGGSFVIRPDDRDITLRDDGRDGDRAARDGIFSARAALDLRPVLAQNARLAAQARATPIPEFVGRLLVRRRPLEAQLLPVELRPNQRIPLRPFGVPPANLEERALMITDSNVVEDPTRTFNPCTGVGDTLGVWTFRHLMTEMANQNATSITPADFVRAWLAQWETAQSVNGFTIPARTQIKPIIIDPWVAASGGTGTLNLKHAPFRLLAIVNRVDLRQNLVYGGGSAGEGRFVFGAIDRRNGGCTPLRFAVIFEYGIQKRSCSDVKAWAQQWYELNTLQPSDPSYRVKLAAITEQFVAAGSKPSQSPNQNALNQLRTNENALDPLWELREFVLSSTGGNAGHLASVTVKQEPDASFNNGMDLATWAKANWHLVVRDAHQVPNTLPGTSTPFLGARAPVPTPGFFWGQGVDMTPPDTLRFHLSLNTCSGCHAGETRTSFTHVSPTGSIPVALSQFLTGTNPDVSDPDTGDGLNRTVHFDDLLRRAQDLEALVTSPCLRQVAFQPIFRMVH